MAKRITHTCGAYLAPDMATVVEHLAYCPDTGAELSAWCRALIRTVAEGADLTGTPDEAAARRKTPTVSTETRHLTPAEMHAMHRDGEGDSLRDIAAIAQVAPETVRRRIAKWKKEGES